MFKFTENIIRDVCVLTRCNTGPCFSFLAESGTVKDGGINKVIETKAKTKVGE